MTDDPRHSKLKEKAPNSISPPLDGRSRALARWLADVAATRDYFAQLEQFGKAQGNTETERK